MNIISSSRFALGMNLILGFTSVGEDEEVVEVDDGMANEVFFSTLTDEGAFTLERKKKPMLKEAEGMKVQQRTF